MIDFDELETIARSMRRDRCSDGRIKNQNKSFWADCAKSSNKMRDQDLKPGNRLRNSAHTPSLAKLKFMGDENGSN